MAAPQSTPLPPAPVRNEPESVFIPKSNAFVAALEPFRVDLQAQADYASIVHTKEAEIDNLYANSANISTVATDIVSVNAVAGNAANINSVNANAANINTVSGVNANVTTVAGISANVTTIAGISADVTTVAGINTSVTTTAGISTDIQTLAPIAPDITAAIPLASDLANTASLAKRQAKYARSLALNPPIANETLRLDYTNDSYGKGDKSTGIIEDVISFNDMHTFTRGSTGTYFDALGVMQTAGVNEQRLTHDPFTGEASGLLIEGQRSNLSTNSQLIPASVGTVLGASISTNIGTINEIVEDASIGEHFAQDTSFSVTSGERYTFSTFVKQGVGTRKLYFRLAVGISATVTFDPTTKTFGVKSPLIDSVGFEELANGLIRAWITYTATSSGTVVHRLQLLNQSSQYQGDGVSSLFLGGRQLELGNTQTSYIPTTTSAVTRSADACYGVLGSEFNASEGTLYWQGTPSLLSIIAQTVFGVTDGTVNNRILIRLDGSTGALYLINTNNGVYSGINSVAGMFEAGTNIKIALYYTNSHWGAYINGVEIGSVSTEYADATVTRFHIARSQTSEFDGITSRAKYIPRALSAAELEALTV